MEKLQNHDAVSSDLNEISADKKRRKSGSEEGDFTRFFINLGKSDQLEPARLIGMINDFTGSKEIAIGAIEILNNFSFFETDSTYDAHILDSFNSKQLKKRPIILEKAEAKTSQRNNKIRKNRTRKFAGQF
jgi:ATP-dependent RNA helicase DeaD